MSLNQLVSRLEELQSVAGERSAEWRNRFFEEWSALEEVNAVVLDETRANKALTPEERVVVQDAIRRLRELLLSTS